MHEQFEISSTTQKAMNVIVASLVMCSFIGGFMQDNSGALVWLFMSKDKDIEKNSFDSWRFIVANGIYRILVKLFFPIIYCVTMYHAFRVYRNITRLGEARWLQVITPYLMLLAHRNDGDGALAKVPLEAILGNFHRDTTRQ